jgi:hypothetical protein
MVMNMRTLVLTGIIMMGIASSVSSQNLYFTKNGHVDFFSSTPMEDIKADNNKVTSVLNTTTGDIEFSMLVMAFTFPKALMQEHFNENYMESAKFPKSSFKGKITNLATVNFTTDGTYPAEATGMLTIHGVTKEVSAKGNFIVKDGKIRLQSTFNVSPKDYKIEIPSLVSEKIAKEIRVTVDNVYEPYVK